MVTAKARAAAQALPSPATADEEPLDRKGALGRSLRQRILSMDLAPGAVLDEVALGEAFGLSRPPVRELMRQMAAEGYIELEANRAARVASMGFDALRNFFLAAPLVYVATTQLAARVATAEDVRRLRDIQQRCRDALDHGSIDDRVLNNDAFHLEIGRIARNPYLLPSLQRLLIDHARLGKTFYQPRDEGKRQQQQEAVDQHDQIVEAIARHDAEGAAEIVRAHMELSRRNLQLYVAPEGLDVGMDITGGSSAA